MRPLLPLLCILITGCGYVGDPLPPALHIPEAVQDLRVTQIGDKLVLEFTVPATATDALPVRGFAGGEARIEPGRVVPLQIGKAGPVRIEIPAAEFAGRDTAIAVRVVSDREKFSEWSNAVKLAVVRPLEAPRDLAAVADPAGVRLTWRVADARPGLRFRVTRSEEKQPAPVVETVAGSEYVDRSAVFGKTYSYTVEAVLNGAASAVAGPVTVTPKDDFAPASPAGLNAIAGLGAIELAWERNTEADLKGYRVYRAEGDAQATVLADLVETPAYSDRQVTSGTKYTYSVAAVDQAGNESARSPAAAIAAP